MGGPRLIYATFDNCCFFRDNNEQSFPDDFPWAIHRGWTGAAEKQTLGYIFEWTGNTTQDTSSVYRLVLVFPHEDKDLRLLLRALWSEAKKVGGESWGMESFQVETLDGPAALSADELEDAWADLADEDSRPAFSALWKLVGAGPQAVEFIAEEGGQAHRAAQKPKSKPPTPEDELPDLLVQMDDPSFQVRQQATKRLVEIGLPMLERLRKEVETAKSPEVRMRLRQVIEQLQAKAATTAQTPARLGWWPLPPQDFQAPRIARVLETDRQPRGPGPSGPPGARQGCEVGAVRGGVAPAAGRADDRPTARPGRCRQPRRRRARRRGQVRGGREGGQGLRA